MRSILAGLLVLTTLAVYAGVRDHGYVYEDKHTAQAIGATNRPALEPSRRMVTSWSYYLAAQMRDTPQMQHALNVGLHLANGALVGLLMTAKGSPVGWLAAGIFLVHPLNTQAVAYAANRADLLMTLSVLMALWLGAAPRWTPLRAAGIVLCALGAIGAKEAGIAVIPLLAWLGRPTEGRGWWAGALGVLTVLALAGVPLALDLNRGTPIDAVTWARLQTTAIWRYLAVPILPQSLEHAVYRAPVAVQWACVVAWLGVGLWAVRSRTLVGFGLGWAWLALLPRLVVQTPFSWLTEHQVYLAMPGVALVLAESIHRASVWVWTPEPIQT